MKKETIDGIHRANHRIWIIESTLRKTSTIKSKRDFIVMYCHEYGYGQNLLLIDREAICFMALL